MEAIRARSLWLWLAGAGIGVLAILASIFGLAPMVAVALIVYPLGGRTGWPMALSGFLTGFGILWLYLLLSETASGATTPNLGFWLSIGVVALAGGLSLLARLLIRAART